MRSIAKIELQNRVQNWHFGHKHIHSGQSPISSALGQEGELRWRQCDSRNRYLHHPSAISPSMGVGSGDESLGAAQTPPGSGKLAARRLSPDRTGRPDFPLRLDASTSSGFSYLQTVVRQVPRLHRRIAARWRRRPIPRFSYTLWNKQQLDCRKALLCRAPQAAEGNQFQQRTKFLLNLLRFFCLAVAGALLAAIARPDGADDWPVSTKPRRSPKRAISTVGPP